ncbi:MAG: hypothetical protein LJE68_16900 [Rhodobacter sp.]|jgi:hypothetical protein|nr:hypothetical protein [Rhodobacter sp.]
MEPRSPSFEANLLYQTVRTPNYADLIDDLTTTIEGNGETLRQIDEIDSVFTLLTCKQVQILIAFNPDPLPVDHFLGAERPTTSNIGDGEIMRRLTASSASATVLVLDRNPNTPIFGAEQDRLKRSLCWDIVDCLFFATSADLVFWSETDTLYAADEFERASTFQARQARAERTFNRNSALPAVPAHLAATQPGASPTFMQTDEAPRIDPALHDRIDRTLHDRIEAEPEKGRLETLLARALPAAMMKALDRVTHRLDGHRMINGIAMACSSTTIGLSALPGLIG